MTDPLVALAALGLTLICAADWAPTQRVRRWFGIPGMLAVATFVVLAVRQAAG